LSVIIFVFSVLTFRGELDLGETNKEVFLYVSNNTKINSVAYSCISTASGQSGTTSVDDYVGRGIWNNRIGSSLEVSLSSKIYGFIEVVWGNGDGDGVSFEIETGQEGHNDGLDDIGDESVIEQVNIVINFNKVISGADVNGISNFDRVDEEVVSIFIFNLDSV